MIEFRLKTRDGKALQREGDKCQKRNSPPTYFSCHNKGEGNAKQSKDLLMMDPIITRTSILPYLN